jgi:hypothetical protein
MIQDPPGDARVTRLVLPAPGNGSLKRSLKKGF